MKKLTLVFLVLLLCSVWSYGQELYRIRIENAARGLVQVSPDKGKSYYAVGRVTRAATRTGNGFLAADYTPGGCVAAVSSHGIRIKVSPADVFTDCTPEEMKVFSIVPKEFYTEPVLFGGLPAGDSGIFTDIPSAASIFANHSPFQGSRVYLEDEGALAPIKSSYQPSEGDVLVIIADKPGDIRYIDFENKAGGSVTAVKADGSTQFISRVVRPVKGVGRYDGTTYDAPGQINTAHGGVITVASSPKLPAGSKEGTQPDTRGGFMIQPWHHANRQNELQPQVMVVGTDGDEYELEGKAPLFCGTIGLWYYPDSPESSFRALVRLDGGEWQTVPTLTGKIDDGLAGHLKKYKTGVTDIRLCLPEYNEEKSVDYLRKSSQVLTDRVTRQGAVPKADIFPAEIPADMAGADYYVVYVDGTSRAMGNDTEKMLINTSQLPAGVHHIQITGRFGKTEKKASRYFLKQ